MKTKRLELTLFVIACWSILFAPPAQAYIDPGTGNFIFQLVIGTAIGAAATFKIWWARVLAMFKPKPKS